MKLKLIFCGQKNIIYIQQMEILKYSLFLVGKLANILQFTNHSCSLQCVPSPAYLFLLFVQFMHAFFFNKLFQCIYLFYSDFFGRVNSFISPSLTLFSSKCQHRKDCFAWAFHQVFDMTTGSSILNVLLSTCVFACSCQTFKQAVNGDVDGKRQAMDRGEVTGRLYFVCQCRVWSLAELDGGRSGHH